MGYIPEPLPLKIMSASSRGLGGVGTESEEAFPLKKCRMKGQAIFARGLVGPFKSTVINNEDAYRGMNTVEGSPSPGTLFH